MNVHVLLIKKGGIMFNKSKRSLRQTRNDFSFDEFGLATIPNDLVREVFGGDITVLAPLVVVTIFYPVNAVCPSATIPAPVDEQVNVLCMLGLHPPGTNVGCNTHDQGTNPVCFSNTVC